VQAVAVAPSSEHSKVAGLAGDANTNRAELWFVSWFGAESNEVSGGAAGATCW
jgi:hypothetical protein